MESSNATQVKVGIFIAIGAVLILGSIFFLGADKALFTDYVRVHAHFEQVQGLAVGSVVSLSGITVGNVEDITFVSQTNSLDVKMKINKEFLPRVRQGSQVEIRTQGALGDKFVFIIPGDPKNEPISGGDTLEVAKASDVFGIIAERGNETARIFDIINELYKITHAVNENNRLGKIMVNLESASASMNRAGQQADKMFGAMGDKNTGEKLARSVERLDSVMAKIDRGEGTLGALINDPTLHNRIKSVLGGTTRKNHVETLLRTSIEKEDK